MLDHLGSGVSGTFETTQDGRCAGDPARCFVYLLPHETEQRFKIGKANDVLARAAMLAQPFDMARARMLHFEDEPSAYNAEKMLHRMAARFHVKGLPRADGHTEWYDLACFDSLLETAKSTLGNWLGLLHITSVPVSEVAASRTDEAARSAAKSKSKEWLRHRRMTANILMTQPWVSPSEQHEVCRAWFRDIARDIRAWDSEAYAQGDTYTKGFYLHFRAHRAGQKVERLASAERRLWVFTADPGHGPTGPMRYHEALVVLARPRCTRNSYMLSVRQQLGSEFFPKLIEQAWQEAGLPVRPPDNSHVEWLRARGRL